MPNKVRILVKPITQAGLISTLEVVLVLVYVLLQNKLVMAKKRINVVPVAENWTTDEGMEKSINSAKREVDSISYLFIPEEKRTRQGVRLFSRGIRANIIAQNKNRKA